MSQAVDHADIALQASWEFHRGAERLTIDRDATDERATHLVIRSGAESRTVTFSGLAALVQFQRDMEAFLVKTGWALARFTPDRRTGADRRGFPRVEPDRRRWWTDGLPPGVR